MPFWMYGPKGEAQLFENKKDVPSGWKDSPSQAHGDDTGAARRNLDVPPGRMDRAAIPTQLGVIAEQVFTEALARASAPPTADERPISTPSAEPDRIGEKDLVKVIPDPVRDQGDKQPHIEAHNWHASDQAKMEAREAEATAKALAEREARRGGPDAEGLIGKIDRAFGLEEEKEPTLQEVEAGDAELTPEQQKVLDEAEKARVEAQKGDTGSKPAAKKTSSKK